MKQRRRSGCGARTPSGTATDTARGVSWSMVRSAAGVDFSTRTAVLTSLSCCCPISGAAVLTSRAPRWLEGSRKLGLDVVVIALPLTRSPTRAVARLGFVPDGEVVYGGAPFRQYRLTRETWVATR